MRWSGSAGSCRAPAASARNHESSFNISHTGGLLYHCMKTHGRSVTVLNTAKNTILLMCQINCFQTELYTQVEQFSDVTQYRKRILPFFFFFFFTLSVCISNKAGSLAQLRSCAHLVRDGWIRHFLIHSSGVKACLLGRVRNSISPVSWWCHPE